MRDAATTPVATPDAKDGRPESRRDKHLVFQLADESYGIPLWSVKEVIGITEITALPQVPDFFKGLINLRGRIISVIDLRAKMRLPRAPYDRKKTCIIIVEVQDLMLGAIVDDVQQVARFQPDQLEANLDVHSPGDQRAVIGVAKTEAKKLVLLLDLSKVLNAADLLMMRQQRHAA